MGKQCIMEQKALKMHYSKRKIIHARGEKFK